MRSFLSVKRGGSRPRTTPTNPHTQLDQNAPKDLQEKVFELAKALWGGCGAEPCVGALCACFRFPASTQTDPGAFVVGREFAHIHPLSDGSLHMTPPPDIVAQVVENGWVELHPLAGQFGLPGNIVMVYGPRDENGLAVVADLLRASHDHAVKG